MAEKKPPRSKENPVLDRLIEAFPDCFNRTDPKPLKIGIGREVLDLAGNHPLFMEFSRKQMRFGLAHYIHTKIYEKAVAAGGMRYGFDGQPTGEIAPEHQEYANTPFHQRKKDGEDFVVVDMAALIEEVIEMAIPGRFAVTIKINELPQVKPLSSRSVVFAVKSGHRNYLIELKQKQWLSLQEAAEKYPMWMAAITGELGEPLPQGNGFRIEKPAMQVFEKKKKGEAPADPDAATSTASDPAPASAPMPLPPPASGRARLSLKGKTTDE